jgi:hypothetical protein
MKTKKIISRLKTLINADRRAQVKQADAIKQLLAKLRKKERLLSEKLAACEDREERKKLQTKQAVCRAQRKKGVTILKDIRRAQDKG